MKMSLKALVATAVVGLSLGSVAHAQETRGGLFIEPGITYEKGDTKAKTSQAGSVFDDSTGEANGFGLVGRLGIHVNDMFFVAADARYTNMLKHTLSLYNGETDATSWSIAPVVGVQTPYAGIRLWAGYVAAAGLDPEGTNGWDIKYEKGTGFLVGGGVRLGIVSLNLEYKNIQFDRMTAQSNPGPDLGSTDIEGEDRAVIASVTFPLAL